MIALTGEHDGSTTPFLNRRTCNVWRRCDLVIVDLAAATFVDSSVIDWLLRTRHALRTTGHHGLRVVTGPPGQRRLAAAAPAQPAAARAAVLPRHRRGGGRRTARDETETRRPRRAAVTGPVPTVFDRAEARAWVLAVWIVRDVQLADELVVSVFSERARRRRIAEATTTGACATSGGWRSTRHPLLAPPLARERPCAEMILSLPDAQREAVELALFGGLSIDGLVDVTCDAAAGRDRSPRRRDARAAAVARPPVEGRRCARLGPAGTARAARAAGALGRPQPCRDRGAEGGGACVRRPGGRATSAVWRRT